jgi:inner membrane protein
VRGPTHALAGATTVSLFLVFDIPHEFPLLIIAAVAALAALLPDMDGSESTIENITVFGVAPFAIPSFILNICFKHRGYLHSLLAVGLLAFLLLGFVPGLPREFTIAIILGYLSHLLTDGLTPMGIPLFYPLNFNVTFLPKILCIRTGSLAENLFFVALLVGFLIFLEQAHYIVLPV